VLAPLGVIVYDCPLQILPLPTVIVGLAETLTVATAVLLLTQPTELEPVTEYEVVLFGLTVELPLE
jgi:hypothetical protein